MRCPWAWAATDGTLEFLDKKHVKIDQGQNFLIFYQRNRGENQEKPMKNHEKIRKNKEKQRKVNKKFRVRDPYFLLKNFLFNIFSVEGLGNYSLPRYCEVFGVHLSSNDEEASHVVKRLEESIGPGTILGGDFARDLRENRDFASGLSGLFALPVFRGRRQEFFLDLFDLFFEHFCQFSGRFFDEKS